MSRKGRKLLPRSVSRTGRGSRAKRCWVLGRGQDQLGCVEVARVKVEAARRRRRRGGRKRQFQRIRLKFDAGEIFGRDKALEPDKCTQQVLAHFLAVIVGRVPGEDVAL